MFTLAAQTPPLDLSEWPVRIGREAQLFVDDSLVARASGIEFRVRQPEKHPSNPLIVPTAPLETIAFAYGSVLREPGGRFRMWYTNQIGIGYAESADGVRWEKPPVGLEIDGVRTNVLTRGHRGRSDTLSVFLNPDPSDPRRRYLAYPMEYRFPDKKGVVETRREGIYLRESADGIAWTERPDPVMYGPWRADEEQREGKGWGLGDVHHISWDSKLRKFIGHVKLTLDGERMRGIAESDDGIVWSDPHLILRTDAADRPGDQIYSMTAFPYESMWLAFIGLYHKGTDERLDIQLASSRDGRHWTRPRRGVFLPNGPEGSFDWGVLHTANNPPIRVGDKLFIYYDGLGAAHNVRLPQVKTRGIGLATLRPDGFVAAEAGAQGGTLTTRPLQWTGKRLLLNAAVRPGGSIRVRLLNRTYQPVSGCRDEAVTGDSLALAAPCTLPAGEARLSFELRNAALYSFRVE